MMGPRLRKAALTAHITLSVGWLGSVVAYLVLDIAAATSDEPEMLRSAYIAMAAITWWAIVPLAWSSLATGILMSLGTKWGLWRHWWVVVSLVLTVIAVAVLTVETRTISASADAAASPGITDAELRALPHTLVHSGLGLGLLVLITAINVVKPRGLTRYGWQVTQRAR